MIFKRILVNRTVRRLASEGHITDAQRDLILKNPDARAALNDRLESLAASKAEANGQPFAALGDGKILAWLWEQRQEILAFVQEIVKLFS